MKPDPIRESNWHAASVPPEDLLTLILQLAYAFEETWGRKMTTTELLAALASPGK